MSPSLPPAPCGDQVEGAGHDPLDQLRTMARSPFYQTRTLFPVAELAPGNIHICPTWYSAPAEIGTRPPDALPVDSKKSRPGHRCLLRQSLSRVNRENLVPATERHTRPSGDRRQRSDGQCQICSSRVASVRRRSWLYPPSGVRRLESLARVGIEFTQVISRRSNISV